MDELKRSNEDKRFQFSLRTALIVFTIAGVVLAAGILMPPGLRQFVIAVLLITAGSAIAFFVLWTGEEIRAKFGGPKSLPIGSVMLTSFSATIIILVLLPLPGGRGPVQYAAGHEGAMIVFKLRGMSLLLLLFGPLVCGLIGKVRLDLGMSARFGWLIAAIASYVGAWYLFWTRAFFPTV